MRIVVDLQGAQTESRFRGIGRYALALTLELARQAGDHELWVALNRRFSNTIEPLREALEPDVPQERIVLFDTPGPVREMNPANVWRARAAERVREHFLASLNPDVTLVTSIFEGWLDDATTSVGVLKPAGLSVAILYDLIPLLQSELYLANPRLRDYYMLKLESLKRADLLLAISESSRREAIQALNIPHHRVVNILGAADSSFRPLQINEKDKRQTLTKFGLSRPFVMYMGGFDRRKNVDRLVQGFSKLPLDIRCGCQLLIGGRIPNAEVDRLTRVARDAGLGNGDVVFSGHINDDELVMLYNLCALFVFPSFHEGFGLPVLEAMQCGAATIGSNATSIPEIIGRIDAQFDPLASDGIAATMARVLREPDFAQSLRNYGLERSKKFSWEESGRSALRAIEGLCEETRPIQGRLLYRTMVEGIGQIECAVGPTEQDLLTLAECIASQMKELSVLDPARSANFDGASIVVEGPFDSSYSLAIANRNLALNLRADGHDVGLESMDGGVTFEPSPKFLERSPEVYAMYAHRNAMQTPDLHLRFCYPPVTRQMRGRVNAFHSYGWEESNFPLEYVQWFNARLDFISVLSNYVAKVLRDNGLTIPIAVTGAGADHLNDAEAEPSGIEDLRSFRFLHISSAFPRKGVDVLLEAYEEAFSIDDDVSLIIKSFPNPHNNVQEQLKSLRSKNHQFPHVIFINEDWSDGKIKWLYEMAHVFIAVSRGEGFGLPMAEAMRHHVPVITTGYGGQRDFCTEDAALLCDYSFAHARTHISNGSSVWVEPSVTHLTELLREAYSMPSDRREKLTTIAASRIAGFTWKESASKIVSSSRALSPRAQPSQPIAWISTWNSRCGIAAYARNLSCEFERERMRVLANRTDDLVRADESFVDRCWDADVSAPKDTLIAKLKSLRPQTVIIQYNYGFFSLEELTRVVRTCCDMRCDCIIFLHATAPTRIGDRVRSFEEIRDALGSATRIAVHTLNDMNRLKSFGIVDNVMLFPHGVYLANGSESHPLVQRLSGKRVIASYGFLLPGKGIPELVNAFSLVRKEFANLHLMLVNSLYPVPASAQLEAGLGNLLEASGLADSVTRIHDYLSNEETQGLLRCAEMVLYPYQGTQESSSAAVRTGLASGRPVGVTPLQIFDELGDVVHRFGGHSVEKIAEGMTLLLRDAEKRLSLEVAAARWSAERSFTVLSRRLANSVEGFRRQRDFDASLARNKRH